MILLADPHLQPNQAKVIQFVENHNPPPPSFEDFVSYLIQFFLHFFNVRAAPETVQNNKNMMHIIFIREMNSDGPSTKGINLRSPVGFHFLLKTLARWSELTSLPKSLPINENLYFSLILFDLSYENNNINHLPLATFGSRLPKLSSHPEFLELAQQSQTIQPLTFILELYFDWIREATSPHSLSLLSTICFLTWHRLSILSIVCYFWSLGKQVHFSNGGNRSYHYIFGFTKLYESIFGCTYRYWLTHFWCILNFPRLRVFNEGVKILPCFFDIFVKETLHYTLSR